jgi:L-alanine-DL-glutamate epimerase-like enolase superfamily enzyme
MPVQKRQSQSSASSVPDRPGFGIELDEERIAHPTVLSVG